MHLNKFAIVPESRRGWKIEDRNGSLFSINPVTGEGIPVREVKYSIRYYLTPAELESQREVDYCEVLGGDDEDKVIAELKVLEELRDSTHLVMDDVKPIKMTVIKPSELEKEVIEHGPNEVLEEEEEVVFVKEEKISSKPWWTEAQVEEVNDDEEEEEVRQVKRVKCGV